MATPGCKRTNFGRTSWDILLLATLVAAITNVAESCSCAVDHPQAYFCKSDFVILVKVKNMTYDEQETSNVIQVRIRKMFKVSDKAALALKHGRLWTAVDDGMCGLTLQNEEKYLLAGRIHGGKAWLSLCNYHQKWNQVSQKQRKGFRLLYKQGCECKIAKCPWGWNQRTCKQKNSNTCMWNLRTNRYQADCHVLHAVCMHQSHDGTCGWNRNRGLRECLKDQQQQIDKQRAAEP